MKFNNGILIALIAVAGLSCDRNGGGGPAPNPSLEVTKSGVISVDETWSSDSIYILTGRVVVDAGAELSCQPAIYAPEEGVSANDNDSRENHTENESSGYTASRTRSVAGNRNTA